MKYFLYARKSSEDKERQVQSIPDQLRILGAIAAERGLDVIETIVDSKSAKAPGRKGFTAMVQRIQAGEAQGILCWKLDRLSRNSVDGGTLMWMLQQGIIQEIITHEKTYYPQENSLILNVEFGLATQMIRDLSTNVKRGQKSKIERGWMPARAPIGYLNEKQGIKGQKRILIDPVLFPIIESLWHKLLTDQLSLMRLFDHMKEQCPIFVKGKMIAFSSFHEIFQNKFYCGLFQWNEEWMIGAQKPMLTQSEFEQAQSFLHHGKGVRDRLLDFPLKGLFRCGTCDSLITAERKTKMVKSVGATKDYDFYRCGHNRRSYPCTEKPLSAHGIDDCLLQELASVHLPDEIIAFGIACLDTMEDVQETPKERQLSKQIADLSRRMTMIESNIPEEANAETRAIMQTKLNALKVEKKGIEEEMKTTAEQRNNKHVGIRDRLQIIQNASYAIKHGTKDQKRRVVCGLGSNWRLTQKNLVYEPHYVTSALKETRKIHEAEIRQFELRKNQSGTSTSMDQKLVTTVWSHQPDSNRRPPHYK